MAWQTPPQIHRELDEELDSEDEEEVLLEELCSGWPSSGKGGFKRRLIDALCLDHLPRGQKLNIRLVGDMVALNVKVV